MIFKDFYPTPRHVLDTMLSGVDLHNKVILEPSAGKGDIIDYLTEFGAKKVLYCELNRDLAKVCSDKINMAYFL